MPETKFTALVLTEINPPSDTCCHIEQSGYGDGCRHLVRKFEGFGHFCFCGVFAEHIPQDRSCGLSRLPQCLELFGPFKKKPVFNCASLGISDLLQMVTDEKLSADARREAAAVIMTKFGQLKDIIEDLVKAVDLKFNAWMKCSKANMQVIEMTQIAERTDLSSCWKRLEEARDIQNMALENFHNVCLQIHNLVAKAKGEQE